MINRIYEKHNINHIDIYKSCHHGDGGTNTLPLCNEPAANEIYTIDGVKVTIDRIYHKKPRSMIEFMKREILFVGAYEDAVKKHGKLKTHRAVRKTNPAKPVAIVFKRAGDKQMLIFQPSEEILKAILEK